MKNYNIFFLTFLLLLFSLYTFTRAEDICNDNWWVNSPINPYINTRPAINDVIDYQVPSNWCHLTDIIDPNFPSLLYTSSNKDSDAKEIRIDYYYRENYTNPNLELRAKRPNTDPNSKFYLEVFKEEIVKDGFLKRYEMRDGISYYEYPLGYIKNGLHKKNRIVLRVTGPPDTFITLKAFRLYTNDTDSDGDGVSDIDEEDTFQDTNKIVSIPIRSYRPDPLIKHKLTLYLEDPNPSFHNVKFVDPNDPNTLNIPMWLIVERFLPFEILSLNVDKIGSQGSVNIRLNYTGILYPSLVLYTYKNSDSWEELSYEILDENTVRITLKDGGAGDNDGVKNDTINTDLVLSYPKDLDIYIEKNGCFIEDII